MMLLKLVIVQLLGFHEREAGLVFVCVLWYILNHHLADLLFVGLPDQRQTDCL